MKNLMRIQSQSLMFKGSAIPKVELVLSCSDGTPWTVSMSAGCERFVGHYPLLPRMVVDGPVLSYRTPYPGS
jgi:hypothetical protein